MAKKVKEEITQEVKKESPKYRILEEYQNCDVYAKPSLRDRGVENPSKFVLAECTQEDLHYLYRRGFRGIELIDSDKN